MNKTKLKTLKGFQDILPETAAVRKNIINKIEAVFESFGFQKLETPTLEYGKTLTGKYGSEADKLIYTFLDKGKRLVGLRYDLTVPACKILGLYQNKINLPFKRYQIQNVFRADKPQRGRFREFTQCDIDIFGVDSVLADAEIVLVFYNLFKALGFNNFCIDINSREVLFKILKSASINDKKLQLSILQTIDKLDKNSTQQVEQELIQKGLSQKTVKQILSAIKTAKPNQELETIFEFLKINQVPEKNYRFLPSLVRGLDYYTRSIFEVSVIKPKIGSIGGGGRYDNLVSQLGGPKITGTGMSSSIERILEVGKEIGLWQDIKPSKTKVLVTVFSKETLKKSISTFNDLRQANVNCELYLDEGKKLSKQLKYASLKQIPYAIIIGPDEIKKRAVILKDLGKREQKQLSIPELIKILSS